MPVNTETYHELVTELKSKYVTLVAVSKTKSVEEIKKLYNLGQRDFGENYVQELVEKAEQLPIDIRWHFIGHLQRNKVKNIIPLVHFIQTVDSLRLLKEINKQAEKNNKVIDCLLQVHIACEETKFGFDKDELKELLISNSGILQEFKNVNIKGLMGVATLTDDMSLIRREFKELKSLFDKINNQNSLLNIQFPILSFGMTADYKVAIEEGSNMVRIGSLIFGERN